MPTHYARRRRRIGGGTPFRKDITHKHSSHWSREREEGVKDIYRSLNPVQVNEAGGLRVGDHVAYKKSERIVDRAWGEYAGQIVEIRKGPSGPTIISSGGVGQNLTMSRIGPTTSVAMIRAPDGRIQFAQVRDLKKETRL
jgi:hypothetical protein